MAGRDPLGVVGMITPWNFPMAIPSWKIMPALICGNTVVIKPAEDTPLSTHNLVQILIEAGLPKCGVNAVFPLWAPPRSGPRGFPPPRGPRVIPPPPPATRPHQPAPPPPRPPP